MRADVHEGPEHMLQSEAGYIDARPHRQDRRKPLAPHGRTIQRGHSRRIELPPDLPVLPRKRKYEAASDTSAAGQKQPPALQNKWKALLRERGHRCNFLRELPAGP